MSKVVISIGVGIVLIGGIAGLWWAGLLDGLTSQLDLDILKGEEMTEEEPTSRQAELASELTTGGDASDQALEEDLGTLDAQLGAYNESSTELDASLEDEPVEQDANF